MPPIFWMSSVASSWTTSTMSSTVTMPCMRPSRVHHRDGHQVLRGDQRATASWSRCPARETTSVFMRSRPAVRRRGEELAERDHPEQLLLRVEHVDVVDGLRLLARLPAQVADRLVRGHLRAQPRERGLMRPPAASSA